MIRSSAQSSRFSGFGGSKSRKGARSPAMTSRSRTASAAGQRVYEDVDPPFRWESRKDADELIIDLTGFKDKEFRTEHVKVKIDDDILKVSGQRPLGGKRWRRFEKDFRMANCAIKEVKALFYAGVISVVMPKLIKDDPSSAPPPLNPEQKAAAEDGRGGEPAEEGGKAGGAAAPGGDGKEEALREKKGTQSPATPAEATEGPKYGMGRRRPRWVVVMVVVVIKLMVGLGYYYWFYRKGGSQEEQKSPEKLLLPEVEEGLQHVL